MATVKVKLRPSKVDGKAGTVFYQVTHQRKSVQITTDIHVMPDQWDDVRGCIKADTEGNEASSPSLQDRINGDVCGIRHIICDLERGGKPYTAMDVAQSFKSPNFNASFTAYMEGEITLMRSLGKNGTASNYRSALRSFRKFLEGKDIQFSAVTAQLTAKYAAWLSNVGAVCHNSLSFYMRNLRAVFNKAVEQGLTPQTFPFKKVYTGVAKTRKRAVGEETIKQLYRLDLQEKPRLALARDMFIFSYCAMGMAFVDMAYLRKSDIHGDHMEYARRKTGQSLRVKVNKCLSGIIDRYKDASGTYVFPIINSTAQEQMYKEYRHGLNEHNRLLEILSKMLGEDCHLSSYTSRHSWATIAQRNHGTPITVISASLGHTTEATTRIYLASLENSVIDKANDDITSALDE